VFSLDIPFYRTRQFPELFVEYQGKWGARAFDPTLSPKKGKDGAPTATDERYRLRRDWWPPPPKKNMRPKRYPKLYQAPLLWTS